MSEFQSRVSKALSAALSVPEDTLNQGPTTRLLGAIPQLNSLSVITVVLELEKEFAIEIAEYEISASEFETIGTLAAYIEKKLSQRKRGSELRQQTDRVESFQRSIRVIRTGRELRDQVAEWRRKDKRIGLVPTMGSLHAGHMALVQASRAKCDKTIVTIFVNPGQFEASAFAVYPKNEEDDIKLLEAEHADVLFAPPNEEIYANGFETTVSLQSLGRQFAPEATPRYFDSVSTIVTKLLSLAAPDCAYFGEKDYDQLTVIRRLAKDLSLAPKIVAVPTLREADGLAFASSNQFLTPEERKRAPMLYAVLSRIASRVAQPGVRVEEEIHSGVESLIKGGFRKIDYLNVYDAETLRPISSVSSSSRVMGAAWLGRPRLIDSVAVLPR